MAKPDVARHICERHIAFSCEKTMIPASPAKDSLGDGDSRSQSVNLNPCYATKSGTYSPGYLVSKALSCILPSFPSHRHLASVSATFTHSLADFKTLPIEKRSPKPVSEAAVDGPGSV